MRTPLGLAILISLPLLAFLVAVTRLAPPGNYWKSVEPPKAQCEAYDVERLRTDATLTSAIYDPRKLDRLIREPQNTISNLAYSLAGLAIVIAARKPAFRNLGLAAIFLGFGSGMYHASLLPEWRMIDILGVYAVLYLLMLAGALENLGRGNVGWPAWGASLAVWAAAIYTGVHRNDVRWLGVKLFDSTYVFVAAVAAGCLLAALAWRRAKDRTKYVRALGAVAVAAGISFTGGIGDRFHGFWAAPDSFLQGHAVWHTFGAVALLATYEAFALAGFDRSLFQSPRSEENLAQK
jgi:hypothetical protein